MADLPCITVRELKARLALAEDDAKVFAWAPGSYMPVASAALIGARVLLEINVPDDAVLAGVA